MMMTKLRSEGLKRHVLGQQHAVGPGFPTAFSGGEFTDAVSGVVSLLSCIDHLPLTRMLSITQGLDRHGTVKHRQQFA